MIKHDESPSRTQFVSGKMPTFPYSIYSGKHRNIEIAAAKTNVIFNNRRRVRVHHSATSVKHHRCVPMAVHTVDDEQSFQDVRII